MRVEVAYEDGLIEVFRTEGESALTSASLLGREGRAAGSSVPAALLRVRLDLLESEGLRVDLWWYGPGGGPGAPTTPMGSFGVEEAPELTLEDGRVWRLVPPSEIGRVISVEVDGTRVAERQAGHLVDLVRLESQTRFWLGDTAGSSVVDRVNALHERIRQAHPDWDDGRVAAEYGYPVEAYRAVAARGGPGEGADAVAHLADWVRDHPGATAGDALSDPGVPDGAVTAHWAEARALAGAGGDQTSADHGPDGYEEFDF